MKMLPGSDETTGYIEGFISLVRFHSWSGLSRKVDRILASTFLVENFQYGADPNEMGPFLNTPFATFEYLSY